jgi:hypothetical protein
VAVGIVAVGIVAVGIVAVGIVTGGIDHGRRVAAGCAGRRETAPQAHAGTDGVMA